MSQINLVLKTNVYACFRRVRIVPIYSCSLAVDYDMRIVFQIAKAMAAQEMHETLFKSTTDSASEILEQFEVRGDMFFRIQLKFFSDLLSRNSLT